MIIPFKYKKKVLKIEKKNYFFQELKNKRRNVWSIEKLNVTIKRSPLHEKVTPSKKFKKMNTTLKSIDSPLHSNKKCTISEC